MKRIEIKKLFVQKNPKLARWIPNWVFRALERLICAAKINYVLDNFAQQEPIMFIDSTLKYIGVTYELHGVQNIPDDQRVIFASNHPLGGLDGLILAKAVAENTERGVKLIVNDLLMNLEPLRPLFVPVNKHGAQSVHYAIGQSELYDSQSNIITFPAGLCSRLIHGEITDPQWRKNFVIKAKQSHRVIVPVYIDGTNSKFFYRLALWRKRLRIGVNIEMILLPREMFAQKGKHLHIYFGKPIVVSGNQLAPQEICQGIRKQVYNLKTKVYID